MTYLELAFVVECAVIAFAFVEPERTEGLVKAVVPIATDLIAAVVREVVRAVVREVVAVVVAAVVAELFGGGR
jgi:hypothetical protein